MNCYSTVARLAKFPGLLTSIPRALAVARIEGWRKARRSAPTLWATTSQASRQTGTSPACSNSSPRPQPRALKPASQCHCTAPARDGQRKLPLTVLTACSNDVRVMQQDLLGPVFPLVAAENLDAAIAYVNDRPHPLAHYLFSDSGAQQQPVLQSTKACGVSVNETLMHIAQHGLPFGGGGPSGMGHYHGKFGFDTLSKLKPVFRQSRINGLGLFSPPYGAFLSRVIKFMLRAS